MRIHRSFLLRACTAIGALLLLTGCPDSEGNYNDFIDRYNAINPGSTSSGMGGSCLAPAAGEVDGDFLMTLSAKISPKKPLLFAATLTTDDTNGLEMTLELQALDAMDRSTPVGGPINLAPAAVAEDGSFATDPDSLALMGAANAITGSDLEAENIVLSGTLCAAADFVCGGVAGMVTVPAMIDLKDSTFTLERLESPGVYPDPPQINCAGDPADPPS